MMSPRAIAEGYCRRSWNPVPVPYKTKTPIDEDWQLRVITESDVAAYFNGTRQNVGVVLGPISKGLTDVDLDCAEAVSIAPFVLPKTNAKFGRPSNPDSHWLYYSTLAQTLGKAELKLLDPKRPKDKKNTLLEVRVGGDGHGAQTVFPGSVHESGNRLRGPKRANRRRSTTTNSCVLGVWLLRCLCSQGTGLAKAHAMTRP